MKECETCRSIVAVLHCHIEATGKLCYHNDQETAEIFESLADPKHHQTTSRDKC